MSKVVFIAARGIHKWEGLSSETKPTDLVQGSEAHETDTGNVYGLFGGSYYPIKTNGNNYIIETGIPNVQSNRFLSSITNVWPGDDSFSVAFVQSENIRRFRIKATRTKLDLWAAATAYSIGTILHPTAANSLVFEATSIAGTGTSAGTEPTWPDVIGETIIDNAGANQIIWTARHVDSIYLKYVLDAVNEAQEEVWLTNTVSSRILSVEYRKAFDSIITEWIESSIINTDLALSRIGFLALFDTWDITVEAE